MGSNHAPNPFVAIQPDHWLLETGSHVRPGHGSPMAGNLSARPWRQLYRTNPHQTKESTEMNDSIAQGFKNRRDYLEALAEEYDRDKVFMLAAMLGPSEDFDGLVTALEDDMDY